MTQRLRVAKCKCELGIDSFWKWLSSFSQIFSVLLCLENIFQSFVQCLINTSFIHGRHPKESRRPQTVLLEKTIPNQLLTISKGGKSVCNAWKQCVIKSKQLLYRQSPRKIENWEVKKELCYCLLTMVIVLATYITLLHKLVTPFSVLNFKSSQLSSC
jgi:hypothetical protein